MDKGLCRCWEEVTSPREGERAAEEVEAEPGPEGNADQSPHVTQHRRTGVLQREMEFFQQTGEAGKHGRKSAEPLRTEE